MGKVIRSLSALFGLLLLLLTTANGASAQDGGASMVERPNGGAPPGHPPISPGHAGGPDQAMMRRVMGQGPRIAVAEPSTEVPPGTIRVRVLTPAGEPVRGTEVKVGLMAAGGAREELEGRTGETGVATFDELATGTARSYRVRVPFDGATYGSSPFRLPADRGYEVRVLQWPTTRDDRAILQYYGETQLQFVQDRLRVIHHADLMNPFEQTYVFPEGGLHVRLPDGFTGFQSQAVMTDQRLTSEDDGFRIEGSLTPGRVRLTWAFDLPLDSERLDVRLDVLWRTMRYGVIAEARDGMTLEVPGFPTAEVAQRGAIRTLVTQLRRRPGDDAFESVEIRLGGIPQPGPLRWIALIIALLFIVASTRRWPDAGAGQQGQTDSATQTQTQLLEELANLEEEHEAGEVGPKYYAQRRKELMTEIAWTLRSAAAAEPGSEA